MEGQLSKFTNLVKGWQNRWFVLDAESGNLAYFLVMLLHNHIFFEGGMSCAVCFLVSWRERIWLNAFRSVKFYSWNLFWELQMVSWCHRPDILFTMNHLFSANFSIFLIVAEIINDSTAVKYCIYQIEKLHVYNGVLPIRKALFLYFSLLRRRTRLKMGQEDQFTYQ